MPRRHGGSEIASGLPSGHWLSGVPLIAGVGAARRAESTRAVHPIDFAGAAHTMGRMVEPVHFRTARNSAPPPRFEAERNVASA
jgi:hypothetical protein